MTQRLRTRDGRLVFHIRLTPKGGRDAVEGWVGDHLKVRVRAVPEDGKANAALLALLAKELGVAKSAVTLETGAKARLKSVSVVGDTAALLRRLNAWGEVT